MAREFLEKIKQPGFEGGGHVVDALADAFTSSGAKPISEASVGSVRFDLVVPRFDRPPLAIDIRHGSGFGASVVAGSTGFAREVAVATGADFALFYPELKAGRPSEGILGRDDMAPLLTEWRSWEGLRSLATPKPTQPTPVTENQPTIFPAMPYAQKFNDTFVEAIRPAAKAVGATVESRLDHAEMFVNRHLLLEIEKRIRAAALVIVDLSGNNPSVLYECGFAHALRNKRIIHMTSDSYDDLPFNVQDWPTLQYAIGDIKSLRAPLRKRVEAAFKDMGHQISRRTAN